MVVGFNHNIRYKDEIFHIQTEDGGVKNPFITTLLYLGGTIIASKKTGYADIIKAEMLDQVVEDLMKEQHKEMLRRLKSGEFDDRAFSGSRSADPQGPPETQSTSAASGECPETKQNLDEIILDYLISDINK
jgi:hypothetical protein